MSVGGGGSARAINGANDGVINDKSVLPEDWIKGATSPKVLSNGAMTVPHHPTIFFEAWSGPHNSRISD